MKIALNSLLLVVLVIFTACKDENPNGNDENSTHLPNNSNSGELLKPKEYEQEIEIVFQENKDNTSLENKLLQAVNLCNPNEKDLKNYLVPACDSKFFKVYPLIDKNSLETNFLVLCRSGVQGFPMRRILVFTKENDQYITTNTFLADLVGMETSKSSEYKDLIVQFMDTDENRFECRYVWREGRYAYDKVMKINGNKIKAQYLDSMRVEIGREISRLKLSY